jgi:acyl carrier protein
MSTLEQQVIKIVSEQLGCFQRQITVDTKLEADLDADSLDRIEILMALEDELDFNVDENIATEVDMFTVGDCVRLVEKYKK